MGILDDESIMQPQTCASSSEFDGHMSNVSGTNALGKQPFSISKNRLGGNGRTIPYNSPAEGTNVPSNWPVNTTQKHNVTVTSSLHVRSFNESNAILQVHGHQPRISTVSEHQKFCDHSISTINEYNCSVKDDNKKRKVSAVCGTVDQNQKKIKGIYIKEGSDGTQTCASSSEFDGSLDIKGKTMSSESTTMDFMHNCWSTPTIREAAQSYENTSTHANYIQPTDRITKTPSTGPVENQETHNDSFNDHMCNNSSTPYSQNVSHLYIDIGDCDNACEYCNAAYWYSERLKGGSQCHKVKYNKCCAGGNVYLEKELEPPMYFKQLFKDKHFLDNIRAYNQMFSMTSFGAEIDDSINDGRGPYVFKICGQIHHWIGTICPTKRDDPKFMQLYIYDTQNEVANRMKPFGGKDLMRGFATLQQVLPLEGSQEACNPHQAVYLTDVV